MTVARLPQEGWTKSENSSLEEFIPIFIIYLLLLASRESSMNC